MKNDADWAPPQGTDPVPPGTLSLIEALQKLCLSSPTWFVGQGISLSALVFLWSTTSFSIRSPLASAGEETWHQFLWFWAPVTLTLLPTLLPQKEDLGSPLFPSLHIISLSPAAKLAPLLWKEIVFKALGFQQLFLVFALRLSDF